MSAVREAVRRHARESGGAPALIGAEGALNYADLDREVDALAGALAENGLTTLGLALAGGPAWVVADLAARQADVAVVPLPPFFAPAQVLHVVQDAAVEAVLGRLPAGVPGLAGDPAPAASVRVAGTTLPLVRLAPSAPTPRRFHKVTYTSGTTGTPKGVCLRQEVLDTVAAALCRATDACPQDRHLAVNPLAVLLENLAGVYAPLLAGASVALPSLAAPEVAAKALAGALKAHRATTVILMPAALKALVAHLERGGPALPDLRLAAVGGAPVSAALLARARDAGVPALQGYGLSECASVVCLNTPEADRPGSVGRPLPHVRVAIAPDGEVRVAGPGFSGYLGSAPRPEAGWWATGDLGRLDADGYLYVTGRKGSSFSTTSGRNVAPEWVEGELTGEPQVAQAAVFGHGRPWPAAVIVPAPEATPEELTAAVAAANGRLPAYARVHAWQVASEPFSPANDLATATGRPRRAAIWAAYGPRLERLYA